MVPTLLFMFFIVLFAAIMIASGIVSWPVGILLGIGLLVLERVFFAASHATDGDDESDEPHRRPPASPEDLAARPAEWMMESDARVSDGIPKRPLSSLTPPPTR